MRSKTPLQDPSLAAARGYRLVPLESVLHTDALLRRARRRPDFEGDARIEEALARALGESPRTIMESLAEQVLERLQAGSAGVSVLTDDGTSFRWPVIAGRWKRNAGTWTPRDLGPCGDALDHAAPLAFGHPEQRYTYLASLSPAPAEFLVVPVHAHGRAVGALWAVRHEESGARGPFDAEDLRRLIGLGAFASAAVQTTRALERLHQAETSGPAEPNGGEELAPFATVSARRFAALNLLEDAVLARETVERLNHGLRESEAQLAIELAATQQLQSASTLLIHGGDTDALYEKLVDAAVAIMQSDMGSLQSVDEARNCLRLLARRGVGDSFVQRFALVRRGTQSACGIAWQQGGRVVVPDVEACDFMAGTPDQEDLLAEGIRAVQSTPLVARSGRLVGIISTHWRTPHRPGEHALRLFDIVARQAADLIERRASEEAVGRLAAIVASSGDAIIGKDLNGIITSWNEGAEHMLGYTAAEVVGQPVAILVPPDRSDEEPAILQRVLRGERIDDYETVRRRKDGSLVDISINVSPVRDPNGRIIGAAKIARDITQRKHAAEALQEADRRKNEFLATLAHELRGPLAPIRNGLRILQMHGVDPEAQASAHAMMERQVNHMTRLIDDLIDINRISRGKLEVKKQPVELTSLVRSVVEAARPLFEGMHHQVSMSVPDRPIYVHADPTRLSQVLGNLLHNAQKFTDRGGRIDLTMTLEETHVAIHVRDNGIGIALDSLPSIFEMFSQVDSSLERTRGGLGIGLSLVKNIVTIHEGTVAARSDGLGQGSEFVVRLPVLDERPALQTTAPSHVSRPIPRRRILVVDDNHDAVDSLATLLELGGHEIQTAHDGLEAVEKAASFHPEVILLDLGLPRLNGYDAARRIRSQPDGRSIKLVALSGWGQEADRKRSREAGFDTHLVKPVDPAALDEVLSTIAPGDRG